MVDSTERVGEEGGEILLYRFKAEDNGWGEEVTGGVVAVVASVGVDAVAVVIGLKSVLRFLGFCTG